MASLSRTPGGWRVKWREGGRGSKEQTSAVFPVKSKAEAECRRIEAELAVRRPLRALEIVPLGQLVDRWAASRTARGNDPYWTKRAAGRLRSVIAAYGWETTADLTAAEAERWRQAGGGMRVGGLLHALLRWSRDHARQPIDPFALVGLRPPKARARPKTALLSDAEVARWQAAAAAVSPDCGALIHCLATYGWRPITAARMVVGDLDVAGEAIVCRVKGGDVLRHPLLPETVALLRPVVEGRGAEEPLFRHHSTGRAWPIDGRHAIPAWFRDLTARKIAVYDLKRWAISGMLERGLPPQTVQLFTGHRTISQVLRYARTNEEKARAALAALRPKAPRKAGRRVSHHVAPGRTMANQRGR